MINFMLKLRNGETREVRAYDYGTLTIHKSINPFEKGLWRLTHKPTSGTLATAKTKKELLLVAEAVRTCAEENLDLLKWTNDDPLEIFTGKDGESHREEIKKICKRA